MRVMEKTAKMPFVALVFVAYMVPTMVFSSTGDILPGVLFLGALALADGIATVYYRRIRMRRRRQEREHRETSPEGT
ncbi:hypothetical protein [Streptomyces alkaliphilus]|uniref:hypothetical protein n=1 Tax=Streptomyces alkaliphilus TaxID=1472722 RepID=UPI00119756E9|nr:hypothetical protein [Streptomyces alkaliphilus]MQS10404.1 hypothetical protein [Streptomyces alkaliphilus]